MIMCVTKNREVFCLSSGLGSCEISVESHRSRAGSIVAFLP